MNTQVIANHRFTIPSHVGSAASVGAREVSLAEQTELRRHLRLCHGARGRWFSLHCAADAVNGLVVGRFVTTLTVAVLVLGITSLVL